jgi:hypothetical protein
MSRGQSATMAREYIARRVSNPLQVTVELTRYGAAAARFLFVTGHSSLISARYAITALYQVP